MSDLISREEAIDAIRKSASKFSGFMEMEMYTVDDAIMAVNTVPSAEPVRHGKWTVTPIYIKCSECGESFMLIPQNYCPYCGADMRGETNE